MKNVIDESKVQFIWQNLPLEKSLPFHIHKRLYYFKVHPNKNSTCKVRGKIKLYALGIILNEGKLK